MAHQGAAHPQFRLESEHYAALLLLACVLSKYLLPAWPDQCRVTAHQVSSAMGKWKTQHSVC